MELVADRAERIPSSLRDEMVWRADRGLKPTATFGGRSATKAKNSADLWRELRGAPVRESSTGPCSSVSEVGCQDHTVCGRTVLVAVLATSAIHVSSSFARPRRGLRNRGTRTRRSIKAIMPLQLLVRLRSRPRQSRRPDLLPQRCPYTLLCRSLFR